VKAPGPEALRRALPREVAALLDAVLAEAERRRLAVWLVGGPVRDLLLGRALRDVDLAIEAHDDGGAEALARAAAPPDAAILAHDRFGTVRLAAGGAVIDLASARRESYARPGALPQVEPGPMEEDLRRRDFSVNALALALSAAARVGREPLLDPGGGVADLEAHRLRVLHRRSFHDDPTRALRAARLAARLRFALARGTRAALRDALRDGVFGGVSGDRIRREIEKLFADAAIGQDAARALALLAEWHVLAALEPGLRLPDEARAGLRRLSRAIAEPPWPAARLRPWVAGLALWLADLDPSLRRRALRRLAVRGDTAERVAEFPKRRDRWRRELARARGRGAVDQLLARIDEESLLALWCGAGPADRRRITRWALEDRGSRPPLTGADLVAAGLSGPVVGLALARVRSAYLDGAVRRREEALVLAREVAARARRRPPRRRRCPTGADRP
jgi:tRNA nucleotidyltransferase (CCA-adding enzyme)